MVQRRKRSRPSHRGLPLVIAVLCLAGVAAAETEDAALKMLDATGVAHMNFLMFTWGGLYYRDGCRVLPDVPTRRAKALEDLKTRIIERIRDNNEWALTVVEGHQKLSFFCGIDPAVMDERALLAEISDTTTRVALGVKMVPDDSGVPGNLPNFAFLNIAKRKYGFGKRFSADGVQEVALVFSGVCSFEQSTVPVDDA